MEQLLELLPVAEDVRIIAGIGIILVGTFIAVYVARMLLYVVAHRIAGTTRTDLDDKLLLAGRKYLHALVYLIGMVFLFNYIEGSPWGPYVGGPTYRIIDGILFVLGVVIVTQLIVKILSALIDWFKINIAAKTETQVDDEILPLVDRAVKVTLYTLSLLVILDHFDVNIAGLLTVLGVGSLAVALASQETIANMIGGFVIMIDRPFRVGDRLRLDVGLVCIVHEIGIRSTKFRTFENTLIVVPNAELMKSTIHNLTYPAPEIRVRVDVGVSYSSDLDHVKEIMMAEADKHPNVMKDPPPEFRFLKFGDSSLDVSLRCRVADVGDQFAAACDLRESVLKAFRRENIEIPFPQRVVTLVADEDIKGTSPVKPSTTTQSVPVSAAKSAQQDYDEDSQEDESP